VANSKEGVMELFKTEIDTLGGQIIRITRDFLTMSLVDIVKVAAKFVYDVYKVGISVSAIIVVIWLRLVGQLVDWIPGAAGAIKAGLRSLVSFPILLLKESRISDTTRRVSEETRLISKPTEIHDGKQYQYAVDVSNVNSFVDFLSIIIRLSEGGSSQFKLILNEGTGNPVVILGAITFALLSYIRSCLFCRHIPSKLPLYLIDVTEGE
jgi:hypothetical protein